MAAAGSLLFAVCGVVWLFGAGEYPFGPTGPDGDRLSLMAFLPEQVAAALVAVSGLLGVPAAVVHVRSTQRRLACWLLLCTTALQVVVFGLLAPNHLVVVVTGYLLLLVGLPLALGVAILAAWRHGTIRAALLGVGVVAVAVQAVSGFLDWNNLEVMATGVAAVPGKLGSQPFFVFGAFLLGGCWAVLGVRALRVARGRCLRCGRPGARWTRPESAKQWGFWATWLAVICPLPSVVVRMTWLLPNPLGIPAAETDAGPAIRLFGFGLGLVTLAVAVVTLGLIRSWGEIWPRWMPYRGGREVPVKVVVIPGSVAAGLLLVGSPSLVQLNWISTDSMLENLGAFLLLPFPLWGAAVALATAAYHYRRRSTCPLCKQG
ncbi:hypothetical protein [Kribbella sp. CA-294648]|uniref:hypothetical protein n=1 Tax=Kribbella sp. CA-294648 TaxID=3239948 RepID=UPI003D8E6A88